MHAQGRPLILPPSFSGSCALVLGRPAAPFAVVSLGAPDVNLVNLIVPHLRPFGDVEQILEVVECLYQLEPGHFSAPPPRPQVIVWCLGSRPHFSPTCRMVDAGESLVTHKIVGALPKSIVQFAGFLKPFAGHLYVTVNGETPDIIVCATSCELFDLRGA